MSHTPAFSSEDLNRALKAFDLANGGFTSLADAQAALAYLEDKLPSLEIEEGRNLFCLWEPYTGRHLTIRRRNIDALNAAADGLVFELDRRGIEPAAKRAFEFTISRTVTVHARVRVEATSLGQAHRIAMRPSFYGDASKADFKIDKNDRSPPYLAHSTDKDLVRPAPTEEDPSP